ncbi:MAG TPA: PQQ-dependent sugar dehydrogenase [Candidatus Methylomirabilis sp.]|nr:PQQ-dependent sugar dehydrogenase [Candidatus Methylomirabilis sp.]
MLSLTTAPGVLARSLLCLIGCRLDGVSGCPRYEGIPFWSRSLRCSEIARLVVALGWLPLLVSLGAPVAALELQPVLAGLSNPLYLTSARDGTNRLFIVEQPGRIRVLQPGETTPTVFLDISAKVLSGGEQGLLGLAFHPHYAINRRFFVNYTRQTDGATVIAEYRASPSDPNVADPQEAALLVIPQPFANHNGGMVEFGPDRFLYVGMGDGGSGNDPGNRAQDITELLGKILRIDVDHSSGSQPYSSPSDNPFFGQAPGRDEIYALGLRNPFRFSFDRATGRLFAGDVGQAAREEIDIVTRGGNYGWRVFEGTLCTNLDPLLCNSPGFLGPIAEYAHLGGRCAIIGGYVYRGARSTLPKGAYVYGDLCTGEILQLLPATSRGTQTVLLDTPLSLSSFGEDEAGEIYVVGLGGSLDRITGTPPPPPCAYEVSPTSQDFGASGGRGRFAITSASDCNWLAVSHEAWIRITRARTGTGNGIVSFQVKANPETAVRVGKISVAGQTFAISQAACERQEHERTRPVHTLRGESSGEGEGGQNMRGRRWEEAKRGDSEKCQRGGSHPRGDSPDGE